MQSRMFLIASQISKTLVSRKPSRYCLFLDSDMRDYFWSLLGSLKLEKMQGLSFRPRQYDAKNTAINKRTVDEAAGWLE